jgi:GTP-binding protein
VSLRATTEALGAYAGEAADIGVTLFSALKRTGLEDLALTLRGWVQR